jgi:formate dehydrogenase subunit gamma
MTQLLARARLIFAAVMVGCLVAFAAPALAQQSDAPIDPQADVVNQQTLLREFPRIQGEINQLDPRARVLIQPAGRVWDHFHEVTLYWVGAIVILGTLAALAAAYLLLGRIRISAGRSGRNVLRFRPDHYRNARLVPLRDGSLTLGSFFELDLLKK